MAFDLRYKLHYKIAGYVHIKLYTIALLSKFKHCFYAYRTNKLSHYLSTKLEGHRCHVVNRT